jgi:hypothetical protein
VHLSYVREAAGHALIGARQWVPREQIADPVRSLVMGLPAGLAFRTKGSWPSTSAPTPRPTGSGRTSTAATRSTAAAPSCASTSRPPGRAYVLRVPSDFMIALAAGTRLTCAQAAARLLTDKRCWEVRSASHGSKGERWYAWAWLAAASARHHLLIRRHLRTGELAFHYCFVPAGQLLTKARLIKAAGLR